MVGEQFAKVIETYEGQPKIILLFAATIFFAIILIGAVVTYLIACAINRKTELGGFMRIGVCVDIDAGNTQENHVTKLEYGSFWVSMRDPDGIRKGRLNPHINWLKRAYCRQYSVAVLLQRFCTAFESAKLGGDTSCALLRKLLEDEDFCEGLGTVSRKNGKTGLKGFQWSDCEKYTPNPRRLILSKTISKSILELFDEPFHKAKCIHITLDYYESGEMN